MHQAFLKICASPQQRASQLILCSTFLPFAPGAVRVNVLESAAIGSSLLVSARPIKTEGTQGASYSSAAQSFKMPNVSDGTPYEALQENGRHQGRNGSEASHRVGMRESIEHQAVLPALWCPVLRTTSLEVIPFPLIPILYRMNPMYDVCLIECLIEYWLNPENAPQLAFARLTLVDKYSQ
ncbi:hypothetical protein DFH08DRAFT_821303 [Mycena albidolilacea]|uniref:Uncharacterized protein n=1 Tax=Mycena albidolilacea TaxID=1033008 RepID=A0AAD7EEA9_9AGAR|nr:hypothetical protein DFH08DRAFT_821303 [Mycena albidolilacea]